MIELPRWIDLRDPSEEELREHLPEGVHPSAAAVHLAPLVPGSEPRPRLETHGNYVLGVFVVAVAVPSNDSAYYQEVDILATADRLLSVTKSAQGKSSFDTTDAREACHPHEAVGMYLFRLVDDIAERYLDLIDDLNDEIDELEENVEIWTGQKIRSRVSTLRHDLLHIRRHLSPLRDAVHKIVDGRVELEGMELSARDRAPLRRRVRQAPTRDGGPRDLA